jgi:hypothetical protein
LNPTKNAIAVAVAAIPLASAAADFRTLCRIEASLAA